MLVQQFIGCAFGAPLLFDHAEAGAPEAHPMCCHAAVIDVRTQSRPLAFALYSA